MSITNAYKSSTSTVQSLRLTSLTRWNLWGSFLCLYCCSWISARQPFSNAVRLPWLEDGCAVLREEQCWLSYSDLLLSFKKSPLRTVSGFSVGWVCEPSSQTETERQQKCQICCPVSLYNKRCGTLLGLRLCVQCLYAVYCILMWESAVINYTVNNCYY